MKKILIILSLLTMSVYAEDQNKSSNLYPKSVYTHTYSRVISKNSYLVQYLEMNKNGKRRIGVFEKTNLLINEITYRFREFYGL